MAVVGDDDQVLDPDPELARQIDAGLDRHHLARPRGRPRSGARRRGPSWTSSPTPCPRPWPKRSPWPAASMISRATASSASPPIPALTASSAACWASSDDLVDLARQPRPARRRRRCGSRRSSSRRASPPCRRRPARPAPISRSPGSACGSAPLGPAATIAGNEGSPPSSRIRASAARATSRSVRPPRPRSSDPAPDLVGQLRGRRGDRLQLASSLTRRSCSTSPPAATSSTPSGSFSSSRLQRPDREVLVLEPDPARRGAPRSRRASRPRRDHLPAVDLGLGALGVAEVGEEEAESRRRRRRLRWCRRIRSGSGR